MRILVAESYISYFNLIKIIMKYVSRAILLELLVQLKKINLKKNKNREEGLKIKYPKIYQ